MARKPKPEETALDRSIASILLDNVPAPLVVRSARDRRGEVVKAKPTKIQNVRDTILRIQHDADPIGFMINVQNGALFEVVTLADENGEMVEKIAHVTPGLKQRIEAAKWLGGKVLPTLSVQHHVLEEPKAKDEPQPLKMGEDGQPSYAQIVHAASSRALQAAEHVKIKVVEPSRSHDGRPVYPGSAGEGLDENQFDVDFDDLEIEASEAETPEEG